MRKNSRIRTTTGQTTATVNILLPIAESRIPTARAARPATGDAVESIIAGTVITASVTYGT